MPKRPKNTVTFPQPLWDALEAVAARRLMPVETYVIAVVAASTSNETRVIEAERARIKAEQDRIKAEQDRLNAERDRERDREEAARRKAEDDRKRAEAERERDEALRVERQRLAAEAEAKAAAAAQAEAERIEALEIPEEAERASTTSGYAGVYPNGRGWKAMYKGTNLGTFPSLAEAVIIRTQAMLDARTLAEENRKAILDSINSMPVNPAPVPDITQVAHGGPRARFKPRQKGPSGSMREIITPPKSAPTPEPNPLGITVVTVPGWDDDEDPS